MSSRQLTHILIYNGQGSNEESRTLLQHALQSVVDPSRHYVQDITPQQILHGSWMKTCCLIIFGGGYDLGFEAALGREGARQIQTFVQGGGSYLGICAGAYWACDYIQFDKGGPLEVTGERFLKFFPGVCVGPAFPGFQYGSKAGVHAVPVSCPGVRHLDAYFEGGGYFKPYLQSLKDGSVLPDDRSSTDGHIVSCDDRSSTDGHIVSCEDSDAYFPQSAAARDGDLTDRPPLVEILGTYSSLDQNHAAVVKCRVGRGLAVLSGVHLEFPCHLLDHEDVHIRPWLARLKRSEDSRRLVFKHILTQLRVQC